MAARFTALGVTGRVTDETDGETAFGSGLVITGSVGRGSVLVTVGGAGRGGALVGGTVLGALSDPSACCSRGPSYLPVSGRPISISEAGVGFGRGVLAYVSDVLGLGMVVPVLAAGGSRSGVVATGIDFVGCGPSGVRTITTRCDPSVLSERVVVVGAGRLVGAVWFGVG